MSGYILAIIWVILTIINFIIFHMMFNRIYFGNPFRAMLGELFGSAVVGILEIAIGQMFLGGLFSLLGSLLSTLAGGALFLLRIILYLVVGAIIIFAVYMIAMFVKGKISEKNGESGQTAADAMNAVKNKASDIKNKINEKTKGPEGKANNESVTTPSETVVNQTPMDKGDKHDNIAPQPVDQAQGASADSTGGVICPNCGKIIPKGNKFCMYCGNKLPNTRICPNCGKEISTTVKFCNFCGAKITDGVQQDQKSESTEHAEADNGINDNIDAESQPESNSEADVQIEDIDQYIIDNFNSDTKVQAIKCYREHTGLGLKEAKDKVDILLKDKD